MKITRITLTNFRQHKNLEIELNTGANSFTVIKGRNGAGKTNLLKAVAWALTGKLAKDESKFDVNTLVSIGAAKDSQNGDKLEVSVKLDLDLGDSGLAQLTRTARFVKTGSQVSDLAFSSSELSVLSMQDKTKGYQKEPSPDLWIENVFPERFSHYFLFDGEHLHRFFKETEAAYVKRAVLEIANIDQLEKIVEHLSTVNQQLVKEAGAVAGVKGEQLIKDFEATENKIQQLKSDLTLKEELKINLDEQLAKAQAQMGDIALIKKDMELRKQFEEIAESASARGSIARKELGAWAFSVGPALMLKEQFDGLTAEINRAKQEKVLPPPYKPEALTALITAQECICGRELSPDSDPCKSIENMLAKFSDLSEIGETLSEIQQPLQFVKARIQGSGDLLRSAQERLKSSIADENEAMKKLDLIKQKLIGHDDANVAFISNQYDQVKKNLDKELIDIGILKAQIIENEKRRDEIQKQIENEAASQEKSRVALKRQQFAEATLDTAKSMYRTFSDQVRESVATNLNTEFQAMIWKKNFFKPVQIDDDYRVIVSPKNFDIDVRNVLSAGETACLAFAFSLTLSKVAGFSYPMVVDSPLGRLDSEVKEFVSSVLAKALESEEGEKGKQLLLLMTDSEYNNDVADSIAHMKPTVMEIVFDQESLDTKLTVNN